MFLSERAETYYLSFGDVMGLLVMLFSFKMAAK
jgi:hypothetical protein